MCGRYAITLPPQAMREFYEYFEQPNFPARYNVAPTQPMALVQRDAAGGRHFTLARWGLIPVFVKDPKTFPLLINARCEGIAEKPSFRASMRYRRCLVVSDAWYEWRSIPSGRKRPIRTPFLFRRRDGKPLAMAGLAQTWSDPQGGEIETGCVVTTPANGETCAIHDRMPALLAEADVESWLDTRDVGADDAARLLRPAADGSIEFFAVGPAVNNVANDGPDLFEPAHHEEEMGRLF